MLAAERGADIEISKSQMSAKNKNGGLLGALVSALRRLIPVDSKVLPKVAAPLATETLSGLASVGIGKLFGSGMITIPVLRKPNVLKMSGHI